MQVEENPVWDGLGGFRWERLEVDPRTESLVLGLVFRVKA